LAQPSHKFERKAAALKRRRGKRATFDRVLIVCEGEKTEPTYFEDIRKQLRLPKAEVRVLHSALGTQPRQIVDYAEEVFRGDREFDLVYAVFDRDEHTSYHDALLRAAQLDHQLKNDFKKGVRFFAVPSVPCFELWLLIHFVEVQAFADRYEVIARVGQHIPGYAKGLKGVYGLTEARLAEAIERANRLRNQFAPESGDDPYTSVDELVAKLRSFRPRG
jgi:hypothetical protein